MAPRVTLLDLPVDIILLIIPNLGVADFLHFTASCRELHDGYVDNPAYWANTIRTTFRVANRPARELVSDGSKWRKLYKRLKTQTRAYAWGDNSHNCLGQDPDADDNTPEGLMRRRRRRQICWPEEIRELDNVGVIADMQGGGWSSSILTSNGALRISGVLDGQAANQSLVTMRTVLRYPPTYAAPVERYDPITAIKQFSHGRQHLVALSDSGRIWSWCDAACAGIAIKFIDHDLTEGCDTGPGTVKKVVAGWSKSAALIQGSGIVVWDPVGRNQGDTEASDAALLLESAVVPKTNLPLSNQTIGMVENFIILEHLIIFKTDLGKVFVSQIIWDDRDQILTAPVEIPISGKDSVVDVQGTFRSFAVFTQSGAVLTSTQDRMFERLLRVSRPDPAAIFDRIKALQNTQVIALAFGDYHFHALHAPGYITSYGTESDSCGSLGLGGYASPEGRLRGIRHESTQLPGAGTGFRLRGDGKLVPHAYLHGRRVWFEKEKREWIKFLTSGGADPEEAASRVRMAIGTPGVQVQGEVSEWVEQEGRDWEDKYGARDATDDDGLPAYFALCVTASGHHSGALVLVNEELANRITKVVELQDVDPQYSDPQGLLESPSLLTTLIWQAYYFGCWFLGVRDPEQAHNDRARLRRANPISFGASPRDGERYIWALDSFPRLRLSNGEEMPGSVPFNEWRYGEPRWESEE